MVQSAANAIDTLNNADVLLEIAYDGGNLTASYNLVTSTMSGGVGAFNFFTNNISWVTEGPTTVVVDIATMEVIEKANFTTPSQAITACNNF